MILGATECDCGRPLIGTKTGSGTGSKTGSEFPRRSRAGLGWQADYRTADPRFPHFPASHVLVHQAEVFGPQKRLTALTAYLSLHILKQVKLTAPPVNVFDRLPFDWSFTEWAGLHSTLLSGGHNRDLCGIAKLCKQLLAVFPCQSKCPDICHTKASHYVP